MKAEHYVAVLFIACCSFCLQEASAERKLIVVLIDGVRWDYLNDQKLKGFHRIAENGVKAPYVVPIYPSLSYPNWYSIATGLYPENHGFVDNFMYDNDTNTFFRMNPDPHATDPLWWNEAEPIWITAEKNNMSTAMYWWGGCEVRIKDHNPMICERERFGPPTPEEREDFIERIDDIVEMFKPSKRFPRDRLSLVLMYYGPTDYAGHHSGPISQKLKEALYDIDGILDKMQSKLAKAGLKDEVNIMIVSDHGMTDVSRNKYIDLEKFSADIKYQVSSGPSSMIVPRDGMLDKLYNDLKRENMKGVEVYKKEDIPTKYHVKESKRMTPLYLVAGKGYLIKVLSDSSKNTGGHPNAYIGNHGYDPSEVEDMRTIFLATGPDFKKGHKSNALNITDLYNVMCSVLKLKPLPNNGSLDNANSVLKNSGAQKVSPSHVLSKSSSIARDHYHYFYSVVASMLSIMFVTMNFKHI